MTWVLRKEGANGEHKLLTSREYTVGRKDTNIILNGDQSISRIHAVLCISQHENNVSNPARIPVITIKDASKYGTTLNSRKVDKNGLLVNSGDKITFGILQNNWEIIYKPFICTSSVLSKEEKSLVRQAISRIGGHLVAEWTAQCMLLIMSDLIITIKVVNALVAQSHIVRPRFLEELILAIERGTQEPDPKSYLPPVKEKLIKGEGSNRFAPNPERKTIFSGKYFYVHSDKQLKKLQFAITMAGGKIEILQHQQMELDIALKTEGSCILQPSSDECNMDSIIKMTSELTRLGIRCISEAEISLAIIHCSVEKFCNPKYDDSVLVGSLPSTSQQYSASFAESEHILGSNDSVKTAPFELTDRTSNINKPCISSYSAATVDQTVPSFSLDIVKVECVPLEEENIEVMKKDITSVEIDHSRDLIANPITSHNPDEPLANDHIPTVENYISEPSSHESRNNKESTSYQSVLPSTASHKVADILHDLDNHEVLGISRLICLTNPAGYISSRNLQDLLPADDNKETLVSVKLRSLLKRRKIEEAAKGESIPVRRNFKKFKKVLTKYGKNHFEQVSLLSPRHSALLTSALNNNNQGAGNETDYPQSPIDDYESGDIFNWPPHIIS